MTARHYRSMSISTKAKRSISTRQTAVISTMFYMMRTVKQFVRPLEVSMEGGTGSAPTLKIRQGLSETSGR